MRIRLKNIRVLKVAINFVYFVAVLVRNAQSCKRVWPSHLHSLKRRRSFSSQKSPAVSRPRSRRSLSWTRRRTTTRWPTTTTTTSGDGRGGGDGGDGDNSCRRFLRGRYGLPTPFQQRMLYSAYVRTYVRTYVLYLHTYVLLYERDDP